MRGAWPRWLRFRKRAPADSQVTDPVLAQVRALVTEAERAAKTRISIAMLNSAALRLAMDLDQVRVFTQSIEENRDHTVSVLFPKPTDLGYLMWGLGSSGTLLSIHLKARLPDSLVYDVDFQSMAMVLTVHLKARTQLSTKLTLSDEIP